MTSVCDGDVEAVEELLERGVDVNLQDDELSCQSCVLTVRTHVRTPNSTKKCKVQKTLAYRVPVHSGQCGLIQSAPTHVTPWPPPDDRRDPRARARPKFIYARINVKLMMYEQLSPSALNRD